jgi:Holliday junction resolvase RusA-like endonuclease
MSLALWIAGTPMPRGSHTAVVRGNRAVLLDARRGPARAKFDAWMSAVKVAAEMARGEAEPLDGPLAIAATFYLARPKHETRDERRRIYHATRPDADKLLRALLDALVRAGAIRDDARVSVVRVAKKFAASPDETGARVTIARIPEGE